MAYADLVIANSPLGFWKLNEPAGTTGTNSVIDYSGNGRHGTPAGAVTFGRPGLLAGDSSTAAKFTSTSTSYIALPKIDVATVAIEVVVRGASANGILVANLYHILALGDPATPYFQASGSSVAQGPDILSPSDVVHLVGRHTGTELSLWVNGVKVASMADGPLAISPYRWAIGSVTGQSPFLTGYTDATIQMVAMYASLTDTDIVAHAAAALGGGGPEPPTPTLLAIRRRRAARLEAA